MATFFIVFGWICFVLVIIAGLALDLVGLFGNWVILAALVVVWIATGFDHFGPVSLVLLVCLALLGEAVEALAAAAGARKFGATKGAMVAAIAGCIAGSVIGTGFMPIVGTLAGACFGAFAAAVVYQYAVTRNKTQEALWTGFGAALGMVTGLFAKFMIGLVMLIVAAVAY